MPSITTEHGAMRDINKTDYIDDHFNAVNDLTVTITELDAMLDRYCIPEHNEAPISKEPLDDDMMSEFQKDLNSHTRILRNQNMRLIRLMNDLKL